MAVYLGSQQVNFNTTYGSFAYWFGFSRSVSMKSTSVSAARTATAKVIAPEGVSIYAYQTISSKMTSGYSTSAIINSSRYYLMGFNVNASLANFYQSTMHYVYPYISSVSSRASYTQGSQMMYVGAMVFALGITDTRIIDSTLMLSYSTVSQSFFTGLIGSFTNISAPLLRSIPEEAFYARSLIESVNFPSCTNIGSSAFQYCYNLVSVSFPTCTSISGYAFCGCSNLTSVSFPNCIYIGNGAFSNCNNLTSVNFPNCTSINAWVFSNCSNLTSVNFPNCTFIGAQAFSSCYNLTSVNFPNCTFISAGAFWGCSNLTSVSFPNCTSIDSSAFYRCLTLTSISFPNCTNIYNNAFASCYNLTSLNLIGVSAVPTLSTDVFVSTPIGGYSTSAGQYGSVYVPASLYNDFIVAENWSDISSCIVSV